MTESYPLQDGGVLRKPNGSKYWNLDKYFDGKRTRKSLKTSNLNTAIELSRSTFVTPEVDVSNSISQEDLLSILKNSKKNAKNKGLDHNLKITDINDMMEIQNGLCAVTGIVFQRTENDRDYSRSPFVPSIDRIDNSKGYVFDNVRLVCMAANYAMNIWGEWVLKEMAKAIILNRK